MSFNSFEFLIFLAVVLIVYFGLKKEHHRRIFLLLASYFFYMWWNPIYIFLILTSTLVDFLASNFIDKTVDSWKRKFWLIFSISVNLGILGFFKYYDFFISSANQLLKTHFPLLKVILPIGISFYTFQTMGYTIDVYRRKIKAEKNLINFALYVSFFPQLVAGPIERANRLLPQIKSDKKFYAHNIEQGILLILWGYFLKVVIADNLAVLVDPIFANPHNYYGINLLFADLFFAFQIYTDFNGYSSIAIGVALILGYNLMNNFNKPYLATSLKNFWHRWHISLSTWFRDYLYIPLGGKKLNFFKWIFAILITFLLSGLWHGANWTFVLWGFFNAIVFIVEEIFRRSLSEQLKQIFRKKIFLWIRRFIIFAVVLLLWIFFRSQSVDDVFTIYKNLFSAHFFHLNLNHKLLAKGIFLILFLIFTEIFIQQRIDFYLMKKSKFVRFLFAYGILLAIFFLGNWNLKEFIYFQF